MSNRIYLQYTKFNNIDSDGNILDDTSYGYRLYDDYKSIYNNLYNSIDELIVGVNEETVFDILKQRHKTSLYSIIANRGLYFNGVWIDYDYIEEDDENGERNN